MKGRIFVVNHSFIENLKSTMEVKANLPPLKQSPRWFGSLISLLADMFQTQLGDYIFFEETKGNNPDSYIWEFIGSSPTHFLTLLNLTL